jgi:hypothetical protein
MTTLVGRLLKPQAYSARTRGIQGDTLGSVRMKWFLLVLVAGLLAFAYREGRWPFRSHAIADCLLTDNAATCLQFKYGWPERDALLAGTIARMR